MLYLKIFRYSGREERGWEEEEERGGRRESRKPQPPYQSEPRGRPGGYGSGWDAIPRVQDRSSSSKRPNY